ncbi:carbamoyltransferase N-terminal domain-containing protein [Micromonospora sp. WMMD998]|uniref:carbamoyltransferase N-terminal domain-containing protein n=1 Tax=Micromonospora sp. WMMD998 TaxID=3016092 RepID=UPI00249BD80D|nr:carbamoyltransferase N-terminal domain-containing protein [Micromonospora sp. WMMD998]WFE40999.1 carbamoyltransferase N-terminal domain-containing protein [Micromonospora sp. WMMD998]
MIVAGLKLTGRGGLALIRNGRIEFASALSAIDAEGSAEATVDRVAETLGANRRTVDTVDAWVVDGGPGTTDGRLRLGPPDAPVELAVAGHLDTHPPVRAEGTLTVGGTPVPYVSHAHLAGHVAAAYCTSPFARDGAGATVLVWDADSFPRLTRVDGRGRGESRGELFPITGMVLDMAARMLGPAGQGREPAPGATGAALADLAGSGTVRTEVTTLVGRLVDEHFEADTAAAKEYRASVLGRGRSVEPSVWHTTAFLTDLRRAADRRGVDAADLAAGLQRFLGDRLADRLADLLAGDGPVDLCFTGSAAGSPALTAALRAHPLVRRMWVPPYPDGAAGAVGAAALGLGDGLRWLPWDLRLGPLPGRTPHVPPGWSTAPCRPEELARLIHRTGRPAVVLRGRLYAGPGPVGSRAILAPATAPATRDLLNRLADRPAYRRAAALCLRDRAATVFRPDAADPHAGYDTQLVPAWRSRLPVVTRADGTARVSAADDDAVLRTILREYRTWSDVPVLAVLGEVDVPPGVLDTVEAALRWGGVELVWADGVLHRRVHPGGQRRSTT